MLSSRPMQFSFDTFYATFIPHSNIHDFNQHLSHFNTYSIPVSHLRINIKIANYWHFNTIKIVYISNIKKLFYDSGFTSNDKEPFLKIKKWVSSTEDINNSESRMD
jgi:hypothetical protein